MFVCIHLYVYIRYEVIIIGKVNVREIFNSKAINNNGKKKFQSTRKGVVFMVQSISSNFIYLTPI